MEAQLSDGQVSNANLLLAEKESSGNTSEKPTHRVGSESDKNKLILLENSTFDE